MPLNPYLLHRQPLVIAHRGASGLAPENSIPAFDIAAAMAGVAALELDIHATRDGVLVVSHDEEVDRMTEKRGKIREMTLRQLQSLDAGYRWSPENSSAHPYRGYGLYLPTLEQIFERFDDHIVNIDIKHHEKWVVLKLLEILDRFDRRQRVAIGSFDSGIVDFLREKAPDVATVASKREVISFFILNHLGLARLWRHRCQLMQISEEYEGIRVVTPRFVRNVQRHDVQLHIWTVNESADMQRLLDWGVSGIISDRPDRLLQLLRQREPQ